MIVGVPKETKDHEYRVGVIPATAAELVRRGHRVFVERGAGLGAGLTTRPIKTRAPSFSTAPIRCSIAPS